MQFAEELQVPFLAHEVFDTPVLSKRGIERVTGLFPTGQVRKRPAQVGQDPRTETGVALPISDVKRIPVHALCLFELAQITECAS